MNARIASPEMTCRELIELLYDFAHGELAAEIEAICRQHLDDCPDCRAYLASYLTTRRLAREAGADPAAEAPEQLLEQILAAAAGMNHPKRQESAP
jgi:anti-sigma factor RsiW